MSTQTVETANQTAMRPHGGDPEPILLAVGKLKAASDPALAKPVATPKKAKAVQAKPTARWWVVIDGQEAGPLDEAAFKAAFEQLAAAFDHEYAGFGGAPKFPTPHNFYFLLRYWRRYSEAAALEMTEKTLRAMRAGGIFDQLAFGFHRYSTDEAWRVPHFEKMLYDQALLVIAYVETYQATGSAEAARTIRETLAYVTADLTDPEGGFYTAQDADTEGEEGKYYFWTADEIRAALGSEDALLAEEIFGLTRDETNQVLRLRADKALEHKEEIETVRRELLRAREGRTRPHLDDKVLADWNGLMIVALAKAARALDEETYAKKAEAAADFVLGRMRDGDGRLLHRYRDTEAAVPAYLDDHAFMIWALVELYEATFDPLRLEQAKALADHLIAHFWDVDEGGFFSTADDGEELFARTKESYDGATPSGNSVAALALAKLAALTGETRYEDKALAVIEAFGAQVAGAPQGHTQMLSALDFIMGPGTQVVIVGDSSSPDTKALINVVNTTFAPNAVVLVKDESGRLGDIELVVDFTTEMKSIDNAAAAYVCRGRTCEPPITSADELHRKLND